MYLPPYHLPPLSLSLSLSLPGTLSFITSTVSSRQRFPHRRTAAPPLLSTFDYFYVTTAKHDDEGQYSKTATQQHSSSDLLYPH
ncbi:hypothetical protein E2C01_056075 [Portunus trituberculatus]|uniref:Uncharacterized protein n=1 Tax=Portunus trituberculatus TaxID=210409 RepID=A0A5B7GWD9_PORTR|nr:hypothetical protein [Portunus trituberculatus]